MPRASFYLVPEPELPDDPPLIPELPEEPEVPDPPDELDDVPAPPPPEVSAPRRSQPAKTMVSAAATSKTFDVLFNVFMILPFINMNVASVLDHFTCDKFLYFFLKQDRPKGICCLWGPRLCTQMLRQRNMRIVGSSKP